MTKQKRAAIRQLIKAQTIRATASQEVAQAYLVSEGIYTKSGKLTKRFGGQKSEAGKALASRSRKRA